MSAQEHIIALRALGYTGEDIGQALARNRSLVSQVERGKKPGNNLEAPLAALRAFAESTPGARLSEASAPRPEPRVTRSGTVARTRRRTSLTYAGGRSTTALVKRQGSRNGGRGLAKHLHQAIEGGDTIRVTLSFNRNVEVISAGTSEGSGRGQHRGRAGRGGTVDMELDPSELEDFFEAGGSVSDALLAQAADAGLILRDVSAEGLEAIELRTY